LGLVALTENLILLQFEFCIDYDVEAGGKVLLNENDVETVCLLSKLHEAKHHINVKVDIPDQFHQGLIFGIILYCIFQAG
jgi:hypothetical protein